MKKVLTLIAAMLIASPALADPVHGRWRTQPDDNGNFGIIVVTDCGNKICGTLVESFGPGGQPLQSPNNGRQIVWDMEPQGGGRYRNGRVYAPDRDRTYNSRMQLNGAQLAVSGCVLGICRDVVWTRVN